MGCDLVCMAEPPLHAVPLFVLREKKNMYDVPHWAHISFFSSYASSQEYDQIVGAEKKKGVTVSKKGSSDNERNIMSTVSIFGCSKGGLHRERYSKLPLTTRLSRVLWPVPISRRDIPISKRISGGSSKGKSITSSSSLKTRQSPVIKMSRHANSFPSRPVRLSTSFDQPKNILLNRHSNDTKSKSATLMLPSQKKIFNSRKSLSLSSSSIPEAKLHDDSLFARSSKGATKKIRAKSDATADTMSNLSLVLTQRHGDEDVAEDLPKASSMANLGLHINIKKVSTSSYSKKRHSAMPPHLIVRGT